jgi:cold shock CspA family protein/ribosome-associated translation inhibitor RaiA
MQRALRLRWRNVHPSEAIAARVEEEVVHLERVFDRVVGCEVTIEAASRHHRHSGSQYRVRVEVSVPGTTLVVGRNPARTWAHADPYFAVREAFREARRQLREHAARSDARVKRHEEPSLAAVAWMYPGEGYGFLRTAEGREIYFHAHAVLGGGFGALHAGSVVRFVEEPGEDGPQASTVVPLGREARA